MCNLRKRTGFDRGDEEIAPLTQNLAIKRLGNIVQYITGCFCFTQINRILAIDMLI